MSLPLIHDSGVTRFVGRITPAGGGLQATVVENRHIPAAIADQSAILQCSGGPDYADAAHAQHEGQEFVGDMKRVRVPRSPVINSQRVQAAVCASCPNTT